MEAQVKMYTVLFYTERVNNR